MVAHPNTSSTDRPVYMSRRKLLREPRFQYRSSNKATASTHLTFAVSNILQTKLVVRSIHGFSQGRTQGRSGQRFSRHILLRCWHRICVVLHGGMVQASKVALAAWGWVNLWPPTMQRVLSACDAVWNISFLLLPLGASKDTQALATVSLPSVQVQAPSNSFLSVGVYCTPYTSQSESDRLTVVLQLSS